MRDVGRRGTSERAIAPLATALTVLLGLLLTICPQAAGSATAPVESNSDAKPIVGAYYYPWYRGGREWRQVMRLHLRPPQPPKLGRYRSDDPDLMPETGFPADRSWIGTADASFKLPRRYPSRSTVTCA